MSPTALEWGYTPTGWGPSLGPVPTKAVNSRDARLISSVVMRVLVSSEVGGVIASIKEELFLFFLISHTTTQRLGR